MKAAAGTIKDMEKVSTTHVQILHRALFKPRVYLN